MDSKWEPGFAGKSAREIQRRFFLDRLVRRGRHPGRYRYRRSGLDALPGTIVLFQFAGQIIATAILDWLERFDKKGPYGGALYFDPASIKVFDPVGPDVVRAVWPKVTRFGQAKWALDPLSYPEFERQLTGIETPKL